MGIPINHVFSEVSESTYISVASGEIFSFSFLLNQVNFLLLTKARTAQFADSLHTRFVWDLENAAALIACPKDSILSTLTKFPLALAAGWAVEGKQEKTWACRGFADTGCTRGSSGRFGSPGRRFSAALVLSQADVCLISFSPNTRTWTLILLSLSPLGNTTNFHERRNYFCMKWKGPECRIRTESWSKEAVSKTSKKKIQM